MESDVPLQSVADYFVHHDAANTRCEHRACEPPIQSFDGTALFQDALEDSVQHPVDRRRTVQVQHAVGDNHSFWVPLDPDLQLQPCSGVAR
jgi:hypothetical protein